MARKRNSRRGEGLRLWKLSQSQGRSPQSSTAATESTQGDGAAAATQVKSDTDVATNDAIDALLLFSKQTSPTEQEDSSEHARKGEASCARVDHDGVMNSHEASGSSTPTQHPVSVLGTSPESDVPALAKHGKVQAEILPWDLCEHVVQKDRANGALAHEHYENGISASAPGWCGAGGTGVCGDSCCGDEQGKIHVEALLCPESCDAQGSESSGSLKHAVASSRAEGCL